VKRVHRLQSGIAFESSARPLPCFRLLLLDAAPGADGATVGRAVSRVFEMLRGLASGSSRDLEGQPAEGVARTAAQFSSLQVLLGYGRRVFDEQAHDPPLTSAPRPDFLSYLRRDADAFPSLPWAEPHGDREGEADVAVQLTGESEASVSCAAVEVWKLIADERLPLEVRSLFSGFGRGDGRGWLEFHDGVSNIEAGQRLDALEAPADPPWMEGGTYMAFLRFAVDLARWRALPRSRQELVVGRDKLTGAALVDVRVGNDGEAVPVAAAAPGSDATPDERFVWRDPPQTTNEVLESSHIHRANQSRASPFAPSALRIFRQGYDFLDALGEGGPRLGLNFVSFQRDLRVLRQLLHLPGWLGDSNFGGPGSDSVPLISLLAGGFYAVPPRADPFPGAGLFGA
jgi:deferrochelatase/peroxidase EfeB